MAAPPGGDSGKGPAPAADGNPLDQALAKAKADPLIAAAVGGAASVVAAGVVGQAFHLYRRYGSKKRDQMNLIMKSYRGMGLDTESNPFFHFVNWVPQYHARPPFNSEAINSRMHQPHSSYTTIVNIICRYQDLRQRRFLRGGKSGDPTQLFLEELKWWVERFSEKALYAPATLDELNARRRYVETVIFSGLFYPSKNFNWTSETFEQTVLQVLKVLDDHVVFVQNSIADRSVEERLREFGDKIDTVIWLSLPFLLFTFSDAEHLERGADNVSRPLEDVQRQYQTGVGLLYRELITCEELRHVNHRERSLTEELYIARGQHRPVNFFVDSRGATIVAPGVLNEMAKRVTPLDASPRYFFDQLENASAGLSGVLPLFLGQTQVLETFVGMFGKLQHLAACRQLFFRAVSLAQGGGELTLVGNQAVNENMTLLLRIVAAVLADIHRAVVTINLATDDALCDVVAAPEEEKGHRRAVVKAIAKSRRNAFKENYKTILVERQKVERTLRECQELMAPILEVLEQSVADVKQKAVDAVESFVKSVETLLGQRGKDAPERIKGAAGGGGGTLSLTQEALLAAATEAAAAAPSGTKAKAKAKGGPAGASAARAGASASGSAAPLPKSNRDLPDSLDVDQLVRHIEMRKIRLDDALAQSWVEGQIAPHRASVRSVDVSKSTVSAGAARALARVFAACPALQQIKFWAAELDDEAAAAFGELLVATAAVSKHACSLRTLDLNGNAIGPRGVGALANGLGLNRHVTWLDLGYNRLGDEGIALLATGLARNRALRGLVLVHNGCTDVGAQALATMLGTNRTLIRLGLQENAIGDQGVAALADALHSNDTLSQLALSENPIGDAGARALLAVSSDKERVLISAAQCPRISATLAAALMEHERLVRSTVYQDYLNE